MTFAFTAPAIASAHFCACFAVSSENGAMPPTWWQPVHFSRRIGATSRWKLGAAAGCAVAVVARSRDGDDRHEQRGTATTAATGSAPHARRALRVVRAEQVAELAADLADGAVGTKRFTHGNEQVTGALGNPPHFREGACCGFGIALRADARRPLELSALDLGIDALELDLTAPSVVLVAVDADDDALALLDVSRETERRLLDLAAGRSPARRRRRRRPARRCAR